MNTEAEVVPQEKPYSAIALDVTSHYVIAEEDKPFVESIHDVFFFCTSEHTYCCEITPSYYLQYLYTYVKLVDGEGDKYEEMREHLDTTYCYEHTEDSYMHVWRVKGMQGVVECGNFESDDDAREYLQGNCPI